MQMKMRINEDHEDDEDDKDEEDENKAYFIYFTQKFLQYSVQKFLGNANETS